MDINVAYNGMGNSTPEKKKLPTYKWLQKNVFNIRICEKNCHFTSKAAP